MLQGYVIRLRTLSRLASHPGIKALHARSSEEREWIETLFTFILQKPSFVEVREHINVRFLDGAPLPPLRLHKASQDNEANAKVLSP